MNHEMCQLLVKRSKSDLRIFGQKNEKVDFGSKTIFLTKERANGSPEAVQILFSKIHNYMSAPTTSFLHPKHAGKKFLGHGTACKARH